MNKHIKLRKLNYAILLLSVHSIALSRSVAAFVDVPPCAGGEDTVASQTTGSVDRIVTTRECPDGSFEVTVVEDGILKSRSYTNNGTDEINQTFNKFSGDPAILESWKDSYLNLETASIIPEPDQWGSIALIVSASSVALIRSRSRTKSQQFRSE